ncbi:bifunctional UDP-sugar hydrolase/5'-nucleotidase [Cohnella sp.]|uniref:bifunctional metallophosphatase/5'-nucleotidase n=1 Tax=Cohnella sp. TaxID=1883426 RepID=UPI0035627DFF
MVKDAQTLQVTLLVTSDIHGHVLPIRYVDNESVDTGLIKLATIMKQIRSEREHVLLIDNGDLLQGTPFAYYHACLDQTTAHPIVNLMNRLQLDAFIPGNHEFNYGLDFVKRAREQSEYPWLSANVLNMQTGEPLFGCPYRIFTFPGGVKIGLLGLTTQYIPNWEQPSHIDGLSFESAVKAAKRWVPYLKEQEGVHALIVSYHGGLERNAETGEEVEEETGENEGWRLCQEIEGIDVLLTGHQHQRIGGVYVNNTLVVQPGYQGSCLAEVEFSLRRNGDTSWSVEARQSRLREAGGMAVDPALVELLQAGEENTQRWLDQPLCKVQGEMQITDHSGARMNEHPLVELVNKIQMEVTGTDISNTALFDNDAPGFGPLVSMREVTANYPYPNTLKVLRLSGEDIREALEWTARYFAPYDGLRIEVDPSYLYPKPQHYNYDMWEGIEYTINVSRPLGSRIEGLSCKGRPLDPSGEYKVVMNHYRASGGGNYRMFRNKQVIREVTVEMTELIAEYLMKQGNIVAAKNDNWSVIHE